MDGEDGGAYPLSGEYREIDPPKRLVFTFVWGFGELEGLEMRVFVNYMTGDEDETLAGADAPAIAFVRKSSP